MAEYQAVSPSHGVVFSFYWTYDLHSLWYFPLHQSSVYFLSLCILITTSSLLALRALTPSVFFISMLTRFRYMTVIKQERIFLPWNIGLLENNVSNIKVRHTACSANIMWSKKKKNVMLSVCAQQYRYHWINQTISWPTPPQKVKILTSGITHIALLFIQVFYIKDIDQPLLPVLMYCGTIEPLSGT